jgi:hypothetical protein
MFAVFVFVRIERAGCGIYSKQTRHWQWRVCERRHWQWRAAIPIFKIPRFSLLFLIISI